MIAEIAGDHVKVDPAVLRGAGDALFEVSGQVRQANVDTQTDTVSAARAFDGWRTGKSLSGLAEFWKREFDFMAETTAKIGNSLMEAASNYTAADAKSAATMVDETYFRGR